MKLSCDDCFDGVSKVYDFLMYALKYLILIFKRKANTLSNTTDSFQSLARK